MALKINSPLHLVLFGVIALLIMMQLRTHAELQQYKEQAVIPSASASAGLAVANNTVADEQTVATEQSACTATVNARIMNQRSGPGTNYQLTGEASRGESFIVEATNHNQQWVQITSGTGSTWMAVRYMSLKGSCNNLPISDMTFAAPVSTAIAPVATPEPTESGAPIASSSLSAIFTAEVQYWSKHIEAWAAQYDLDPNIIATVIQIESCGDPSVNSSAGAQGLFQVMPFHFTAGEDMLDVETNARRGLNYLVGALELTNGDVGLALAGYNGGYGVISSGRWATETQRYYYWGSGIYTEASSGATVSTTLQEWLSASGSSLCARARQSQQVIG